MAGVPRRGKDKNLGSDKHRPYSGARLGEPESVREETAIGYIDGFETVTAEGKIAKHPSMAKGARTIVLVTAFVAAAVLVPFKFYLYGFSVFLVLAFGFTFGARVKKSLLNASRAVIAVFLCAILLFSLTPQGNQPEDSPRIHFKVSSALLNQTEYDEWGMDNFSDASHGSVVIYSKINDTFSKGVPGRVAIATEEGIGGAGLENVSRKGLSMMSLVSNISMVQFLIANLTVGQDMASSRAMVQIEVGSEHIVGQGYARDYLDIEVGFECRLWNGTVASEAFYACAVSYKRVLSGTGSDVVLFEKTDPVTLAQSRTMIHAIEI